MLPLTFIATLVVGETCLFVATVRILGSWLSQALFWLPIPMATSSFLVVLTRSRWLQERPGARKLMIGSVALLLTVAFAFLYAAYGFGAAEYALRLRHYLGSKR